MRRVSAALCFCLALLACGRGSRSTQYPASVAATLVDEAVELTALLPQNASNCLAARPSLVSREHLEHVLRISASSSLVWLPELSVRAAAQGKQTPFDRAGGTVLLLRVGVSQDEARRVLRSQRAMRVAFSDEPSTLCSDAECVASTGIATFLDEHTIRIVSGFWDSDADESRTRACIDLVRSMPTAIEIHDSAHRQDNSPVQRVVLMPTATGVEIQTTLFFGDEIEFTQPQIESFELFARRSGGHLEVRGGVPMLVTRKHWDDLALESEDARRARDAARRESQTATAPIPVEEVDVINDGTFYEELALRVEATPRPSAGVIIVTDMSDGTTVDASGNPEALRLLERRIAAVPADQTSAMLLLTAYMRLQQFAKLIETVDRVYPAGADGAGRMREMARAASLRVDAATLPGGTATFVDRVVSDGLVTRREAVRFVAMLRDKLEGNIDQYASYERATLAEFNLRRRASPRLVALSTPISGKLLTLPAALFVVASASNVHEEAGYMIRYSGRTTRQGAFVVDSPLSEVAHVVASNGEVSVAWLLGRGMPLLEEDFNMTAGEVLRGMAASGSFEIALYANGERGMHMALAARGVINGPDESFRITEISRESNSSAWQMVDRYFVAPLADLSPNVFPPPEFTVHTEAPNATNEFQDFMTSRGVLCRVTGLDTVICRMPVHGAAVGAASLADFAVRRMNDAPQRSNPAP